MTAPETVAVMDAAAAVAEPVTEAETVYFSEPSGEGEEPAQFRVRRPGGASVAEPGRELKF